MYEKLVSCLVRFVRRLKSSAFEGELQENEILVTSDTIVWHNDKAVGKPNDKQDAFTILKSLSNTTHEVITSVCFKTILKQICCMK
jgi:septum formation protein